VAETASITRREAKVAVDTFINHYLANTSADVTPETIVSIQAALTGQDLQIRDYLLGLTLEYPLDQLTEAVSVMGEFLPEGNRASVYSVLGAYTFQSGDTDKAQEYLSLAFADSPDYSLALLLRRVFNSGMWTPESFITMAQELHSKVVAGLDDTIIE
jgi:hypothetical protein